LNGASTTMLLRHSVTLDVLDLPQQSGSASESERQRPQTLRTIHFSSRSGSTTTLLLYLPASLIQTELEEVEILLTIERNSADLFLNPIVEKLLSSALSFLPSPFLSSFNSARKTNTQRMARIHRLSLRLRLTRTSQA